MGIFQFMIFMRE